MSSDHTSIKNLVVQKCFHTRNEQTRFVGPNLISLIRGL